jgi:hypothetical protein
MFKRLVNYSNRHFKLFKLIEDINDLRVRPYISSAAISASILSILFCNLGSLNKFNQARDTSAVKNIAGRIPSASTVARAADSIDIDTLREIAQSIYPKAKRSKMIKPYYGKWIGILTAMRFVQVIYTDAASAALEMFPK